MRVLIAEDDSSALEFLTRTLAETGCVDVVATTDDGAECLALYAQLLPDVVFLDVNLNGMNGLQVAKQVRASANGVRLVFVTGYPDYAVDAFRVHADDYILKKPDADVFRTNVLGCVTRLQTALATQRRASHDGDDGGRSESNGRRIAVKDRTERTVRLIDIADITCVKRTGRTSTVITKDGAFETYYTLSEFEEWLPSERFFRACRSAIINIGCVEHLVPNGDGSYDLVVVRDGNREFPGITVSRSRSKELLDRTSPRRHNSHGAP